jgi:flagellum-specific ATP synthase
MNTDALLEPIGSVDPMSRYGKVTKVIGLVAEAIGPPDVALGELCILGDPETSQIRAEVVGF